MLLNLQNYEINVPTFLKLPSFRHFVIATQNRQRHKITIPLVYKGNFSHQGKIPSFSYSFPSQSTSSSLLHLSHVRGSVHLVSPAVSFWTLAAASYAGILFMSLVSFFSVSLLSVIPSAHAQDAHLTWINGSISMLHILLLRGSQSPVAHQYLRRKFSKQVPGSHLWVIKTVCDCGKSRNQLVLLNFSDDSVTSHGRKFLLLLHCFHPHQRKHFLKLVYFYFSISPLISQSTATQLHPVNALKLLWQFHQ